ncbi:molybdenum cofactor biosynthesis protein MoaE [Microbacterium sp. SORGH_AS_0888]|uniref:molybdenum cofactor biosynthesis protein MoaE n=1 Tax=Microbacterium sp. SORGH_AS_0888 TaxID=3041791 RepID=UPI002784EF53|nr:molybdenum cofactor biosynthesis protein MoaE [Microbacterium sp. SORGH_AS_0888]MDQ1128607.1 molybdopterin synthase catalytic subunit [Microbacterium sp. SORGH_AS_0888]
MTSFLPTTDPSRRVVSADISAEPIGVPLLLASTRPPSAGAIVTFDGAVRDHDEGRGVTALRYSAHPSAADVIASVAREIAAEFPDVTLAVAHRIGDLVVGDCALACVVSSAHRREAFAACAELVDRVKERVPIWKEQVFVTGETEWVNAIG